MGREKNSIHKLKRRNLTLPSSLPSLPNGTVNPLTPPVVCKSLVIQWSTQPAPSLARPSKPSMPVMVLSSPVQTPSLVSTVSPVMPISLFSSTKTKTTMVPSITPPAGMPPSTASTMVQPPPVFSSWKPSTPPPLVSSTSKSLVSQQMMLSQSN